MNSKKRFFTFLTLSFLFFLTSLFFSCKEKKNTEILKQEQRFIINYGNFEDEIDLFDIMQQGTNIETYIHMRNGFFYITNGKSKKVMQFTSYGDLLGILYNSETNPTPSFSINENIGESVKGTQMATAYQFQSPSNLAVDSNKNIYVVDQLPQERQELDPEKNIWLKNVVLRFSSNGEYLDYLGQQGLGGTPFPYIQNVFCTEKNEPVVVSITNNGYIVNWFNQDGFPLFTVPIEINLLPNPFETIDKDVYKSLDIIIPDYNTRTLYLKIDYYQSEIDPTSGFRSAVSYAATYIYPLNVETGIFGEPVLVPSYEEQSKDSGEADIKPYELLGITESGYFFFITPLENGYDLQIMQSNGQKIIHKKLLVQQEDLLFSRIDLSKEGIISAILANNFEASVVWWRADETIDSLIN